MPIQEVIVIGTTHHNTLGVIRALGESSLHLNSTLVLYGEKESYLTQSIYVSRTLFVDHAEGITKAMLGMATEEKQIVIAVTDEASHQLDVNAEKLLPYFYFFKTNQQGQLTQFMDKEEQDAMAKQVGFYVPANYTPDAVSYPCLLKPLASIAGGKRVIICNNKEAYRQAITEFPNTRFQIQQYLQKEEEIVLVGLAVGAKVHIPAYVLKHRELWGGTTYSTVHPISELDNQLLIQSKNLISAMGYEGLFGVEFLLCEGKYYFIEVNLRTDATCYAVAVAGVNLPLAYVLAVKGEPIDKIIQGAVRTIDAMVEFRDIEFVLNWKLSLFKWLSQRNHSECLYFMSKFDVKPYKINKTRLRRRLKTTVVNKIQKLLRLKK